MTTLSCTPYAFATTTKVGGFCGEWFPEVLEDGTPNPDHVLFLELYNSEDYSWVENLPDDVSALVSWDVEELNKFLRDNGFSIQLEELSPDTFGVVIIIALAFSWVVKGRKLPFRVGDEVYTGAYVRGGEEGLERFKSSIHPWPVVKLNTLRMGKPSIVDGKIVPPDDEVTFGPGDDVYMTIAGKEPVDDLRLYQQVMAIHSSLEPNGNCEVIFPQDFYHRQGQIDMMLGMWTYVEKLGATWKSHISQWLEEMFAEITHKGVVIIVAAASAHTLEVFGGLEIEEIDQPYFLWVVRNGTITACYYFDQEVWRLWTPEEEDEE